MYFINFCENRTMKHVEIVLGRESGMRKNDGRN
jgi:hypothetical protein